MNRTSSSFSASGFLQAIINSVQAHMAVLDERGTIIATNKAWDDFGDRNGLVLPASGTFNYLEVCEHSDDPVAVSAAAEIRSVIEGATPSFELEYPCHSPQEQRWFFLRATRFQQEGASFAVLVHENITGRKVDELQVRTLLTAIEQSGDGILIANSDGVCSYANSQFSRISGFPKEEVVGATAEILTKWESTQSLHAELVAAVESGDTWRGELPILRKDGEERWVSATVSPVFDGKGEATHFISVIKDVTEVRRARARERELESQYWQAQKLEAIGTLAGGIAHDLNNILSAIFGYSELLADSLDPQTEAYHDVDCIRMAGQRARDLVHQILTFSRSKEVVSEPVRVDLIVKEALKLIRATISTAVTIHQDVDAEDCLVLSDPGNMHQVIMNLCTNAYQAMGEEGGDLTVALHAEELDDAALVGHPDCRPGKFVHLYVSDTGPGIPDEIRHRIFDPFFSTKAPGKGTGLGLATVHGIVKRLNGFIKVESEAGRGAAIHVYLPCVPAQYTPLTEMPLSPANGTESILVLDDDEAVLHVIARMLHRYGYRVAPFHDAGEALAAIEADPTGFDLVLTDQQMPHITGRELANRIHQLHPGLPIVVMTGFSEVVTAESVQEYGLAAIIYKPLSHGELAATIRRALDDSPILR